jgi:uncharacterized repeat protein (TIGR01451 family)
MRLRQIAIGVLVAAIAGLGAGGASAATPAPRLRLDPSAYPTNFSTAQSAECLANPETPLARCDAYEVTATNVGARITQGTIVLTDTVPAGLTIRSASLIWSANPGFNLAPFFCTTSGQEEHCSFEGEMEPDETLKLEVFVTVDETAAEGPLQDRSAVSGGGSPGESATVDNRISSMLPPFGFTGFSALIGAADGSIEAQAGAHPYAFQTTIDLANAISTNRAEVSATTSVHDLRDAVVDLPVGLLGSALAAPRCPLAELSSESRCPAATTVGRLLSDPTNSNQVVNSPIWNLTPERGVAAEYGFVDLAKNSHVLYARVEPSPEGYVLQVTSPDTPQVFLTRIVATFYGDPAARDASGNTAVPQFTMPADCDGSPLITHVYADSWQEPGRRLADGSPDLSDPRWVGASSASPPVTGCNLLRFHPTLSAATETTQADSPTGLGVTISVSQSSGTETLATPPLRDAVVTLPPGLVVNPSSANGLAACSEAAVGISASGQPDGEPPSCPDASKIGSVELETPLLPGTLEGQVYLARQSENPFDSLLAIYIVVDDPSTGVLVKIPAEVRSDQSTGQLTAVVSDTPQFPFSVLRTQFFGGPRAALRTPTTCGSYQVESVLTPWSAPDSGPASTPSATVRVGSGAAGAACASSEAQLPNQPSFEAGTTTPLAGAYSPFVLKLSRSDGSQELTGIDTTLPKGLLGRLTGVPYCPDAALATAAQRSGAAEQASSSCPSASQVGVVDVGAGAGPQPFYVQGKAYLAGPYKGAPLSLAIITPAVAGPFDLGTVVVRTALNVDPFTAQIHAVSDPFPHILQGIPLDIRSIALTLNKPNFTLNPTSCDPATITGGATSLLGNVAPLSQRFQVGGCGALKFKPQLKLSLKGSTRHAGHPALKAVLTYPKGGGYANIARAQVNLPHSEFIDQANLNRTCTKPVLLAGACPASTIYGRAKAWTPLEQAPLEGPVYLVGGFGYKLPAMVAELNGQIRVLLAGKVDSGPNKGIRNTFEAVPDAPVERFELNLKGGPKYSLLENSEDLCARPQRAIARFTAQNGAVLQSKPLIANQCGKKSKNSKKGGSKKK